MKISRPNLAMPRIDLKAIVEDFRTLDPKDPGVWPLAPKVVILIGLFATALFAAWWFGWSPQLEELDTKRQQMEKLKDEWLNKKRQAINLEEHRKQLAEINRSFGALLKQLPNASEMESLLVEVNQAGLGRGLEFELFKPGAEVTRDFYAEVPITIQLTGSYHDLGAFAGDIAKLPRIVTLNDINLVQGKDKDGSLALGATAKTFRYLDEEELAAQRRAKDKSAASKAGGGK